MKNIPLITSASVSGFYHVLSLPWFLVWFISKVCQYESQNSRTEIWRLIFFIRHFTAEFRLQKLCEHLSLDSGQLQCSLPGQSLAQGPPQLQASGRCCAWILSSPPSLLSPGSWTPDNNIRNYSALHLHILWCLPKT